MNKIQCQEKSPKTKLKNRQTAEKVANGLLYLLPNQTSVLDLISDYSITYNNLNVIFSQRFVAGKVGCTIRTVNSHVKTLDGLKIIDKRSRGWQVVDVKNSIYKSRTCEYKLTANFKNQIKLLFKYLPKFHPLWKKLFARIPSIGRLIRTFCLLSFISLNTSYLNNNNNLIQSNEMTIYGQRDGEISQKDRKEVILLSRTLSSHDIAEYVVPEEHPINVYTKYYPYNKYNIESLIKLRGRDKNMNNIDLRFCNERIYKKLSPEEKKIASNYHNGRKQYGSIQLYEASLRKRNLCGKVWKPKFPIVNIAPDKLDLIKRFPEVVKQDVRRAVANNFSEKKNYNWIFDYCMTRCKMRNLSTREILKKYGFENIRVKREDAIKPKSTEINEKFRYLIGEEVFSAYTSKVKDLSEKET